MKFLELRRNHLAALILGVGALLAGFAILFFTLSPTSHNTGTVEKKSKEVLTLLAKADSLKNYNVKRSVSLTSQAEEIVVKEGLDSLLPKVFMTQGKLLVYNSEYPQALEKLLDAETYYAQAPDLVKNNSNYKRDYAICLQRISEVHFQLNRLDQALEYIEASIKIYKELGDHYQLAKATSNLGSIYFKKGLNEKALTTFLQVLNYHNTSGDNEDLHTLYSNIGSANLILNNLEASIEYLKYG